MVALGGLPFGKYPANCICEGELTITMRIQTDLEWRRRLFQDPGRPENVRFEANIDSENALSEEPSRRAVDRGAFGYGELPAIMLVESKR